ncbi:RTA1-domain-containing protein [Mycena sp. CBHHK59/15]|nr:RTA1-domain-containing protein [Mycena sp. CBHHK59/15]
MASFNPMSFTALYSRDDAQTIADDANYGYVPQESVAILFIVLFGISTILHIGQAIHYRMWWLFPTACLCGVGEIIGWSGRIWSSISPTLKDPFLMQITTTIISPTPLIAVNFILLTRIILRLGSQYSWITPHWYSIVFVSCDLIALVIQGIGGGMASSANDLANANIGAHVMLGGIVFQFVAIVVYTLLSAQYLWRYTKNKPVRSTSSIRATMDKNLKIMICALVFSTIVLFIRSIYRIIELATGWDGRIIHTEVYFNVLDGGMVVLAIFTMNFFHPGMFLESTRAAEHNELKSVKIATSSSSIDGSV